jgi:hypothetical protein
VGKEFYRFRTKCHATNVVVVAQRSRDWVGLLFHCLMYRIDSVGLIETAKAARPCCSATETFMLQAVSPFELKESGLRA